MAAVTCYITVICTVHTVQPCACRLPMRGLSHPLFFVFAEPHPCPSQVAQGQNGEPGQPDPESFPLEHHCPIQSQDWEGGHRPPAQKCQYQECECCCICTCLWGGGCIVSSNVCWYFSTWLLSKNHVPVFIASRS